MVDTATKVPPALWHTESGPAAYLCSMHQQIIALLVAFVLPALLQAQVTDTLNWERFQEGTATLYTSPNGGYIFGKNGYGDKAKAQTFAHTESHVLRGALMQFGAVTYSSGNQESKIRVTVFANNGIGRTTNGMVVNAPDSVLAFKDVPVSALPTDGSLFEVDLSDSSLAFFGMFSIGIDLTMLADGDTVALLSTTDGDGENRQAVWELEANGEWITVLTAFSWELDVDLAIFPLVDVNDPLNVPDLTVDARLFPNPTSAIVTLELGTHSNWHTQLMGMDGRITSTLDFTGERATLDLSELPSGIYVLRVSDGIRSATHRVIRQ
jgi:hypothetical protein